MTVGQVIQALWDWPAWLALGVAATVSAGALLACCVTVTLIESRERMVMHDEDACRSH